MSKSEFQWDQLGKITRRFLEEKRYSRRSMCINTGVSIGATLAAILGVPYLWDRFWNNSSSDLTQDPRSLLPKKEILGYVPHWVIGAGIDDEELNHLTTLAYFNLPLGGDGNPLEGNFGYQVLQSKEAKDLFERAKKSKTQLMLTTAIEDKKGQMDNKGIAALMADKEAQQRAIEAIIREKKKHGFDSINIDFEYWGEVTPELRTNFSNFVEELRNRADCKVTVAVYASSATHYHMYDIAKLGQVSDGLAIMAYDFYGPDAKIVAPTAPLYGHKERGYWYDIKTAVLDFKALVPAEKITLAVPYYGYAYPVVHDGEKAPVRPSFKLTEDITIKPKILTNSELREILALPINKDGGARSGWDAVVQERWYSYLTDYNGIPIRRMVYMEDADSIAAKSAFIIAEGLGGIGIWASGYNHDDETIGRVLREKFSR